MWRLDFGFDNESQIQAVYWPSRRGVLIMAEGFAMHVEAVYVEAVQYLTEEGEGGESERRSRSVRVPVPERLMNKLEEAEERGCRLTFELGDDGRVQVALEHEEGDFDTRTVANKGTQVIDAAAELLEAFKTVYFDHWLKLQTEELTEDTMVGDAVDE